MSIASELIEKFGASKNSILDRLRKNKPITKSERISYLNFLKLLDTKAPIRIVLSNIMRVSAVDIFNEKELGLINDLNVLLTNKLIPVSLITIKDEDE